MKDILETLQALQNTPVPNLLVVAGFILLFLSFVGKFGAFIELPRERQKWAAIIGTLLLVFGIGLFIAPSDTIPPDADTVTPNTPTATPVTPTNTPMGKPTGTPMPEPPTDTPPVEPPDTPTPSTIPTPTVSPEQVVRDYYLTINNRQYEVTWVRLSTHFKDKFNCCTEDGHHDFGSYIEWWDSVARVDIGEVTLIQQSGNTATVFAQLSYLMKSGNRIYDDSPYIQLIFDTTSGTWLFYDNTPNP